MVNNTAEFSFLYLHVSSVHIFPDCLFPRILFLRVWWSLSCVFPLISFRVLPLLHHHNNFPPTSLPAPLQHHPSRRPPTSFLSPSPISAVTVSFVRKWNIGVISYSHSYNSEWPRTKSCPSQRPAGTHALTRPQFILSIIPTPKKPCLGHLNLSSWSIKSIAKRKILVSLSVGNLP